MFNLFYIRIKTSHILHGCIGLILRFLANSSMMSSKDNLLVVSCSTVDNARLSSLYRDKHDLHRVFTRFSRRERTFAATVTSNR